MKIHNHVRWKYLFFLYFFRDQLIFYKIKVKFDFYYVNKKNIVEIIPWLQKKKRISPWQPCWSNIRVTNSIFLINLQTKRWNWWKCINQSVTVYCGDGRLDFTTTPTTNGFRSADWLVHSRRFYCFAWLNNSKRNETENSSVPGVDLNCWAIS